MLKEAKLKPADVGGVGLSGQMHGSVFVGKIEKPLRPAILWNDQRTQPQCDEISAAGTGAFASVEEACRAAIEPAEVRKPNRRTAALYDRHHAVYAKLYGDLKDRFAEIASL